nr:hypothetical protein Iba_chr01cCG14360 [Ipomoea batatas]
MKFCASDSPANRTASAALHRIPPPPPCRLHSRRCLRPLPSSLQSPVSQPLAGHCKLAIESCNSFNLLPGTSFRRLISGCESGSASDPMKIMSNIVEHWN